MDSENRGEQISTEAETKGAQGQVRLEAIPTSDGRLVVPAEGSVWQFYFPAGKTPTEDQMRVAVGALGAVKAMQAGHPAHTTWDASVDDNVSEIVDFAGRSVIDPAVRAEAVDKATRADAFDERVESEVRRIVGERIAELELSANEQVAEFERTAAEADRRARAAEQQLAAALELASEKSVLPESPAPATVEDVGEIMVEPDIDFTTSTVRGEERKA